MKTKTALKRAKELDFTTENEFFDYMIESYENGQITQCKSLFGSINYTDRKTFIMYLSDIEEYKEVRNFYFQLL